MSVTVAVSTVEGMRDRVTEVVADCLGLDPAEIDPTEPLALYGLDSLRSIELGAVLEDAFDRSLPDEIVADHPSIDALIRILDGGEQFARAQDGDRAGALMRADSVLPFDIRPGAAPTPSSSTQQVLLTGATGYLGAHLLKALLTDTDAKVLCLVRDSGSGAAPGQRVRRSLERYRLWDNAFSNRIRTVAGDLSRPGLGLTAPRYAMVESAVGAIYHAAADVNWVSPYGALRATNVIATRELLRLACHGRPKAFHFISSLSVCHAVGESRFVAEDDDLLASIERLPLGYAQSKCVAEALVRQAHARGLRTSIHRPALLTGDSATGVSKHDDLVSSLFKGCIQMGTAPDLDWRIDAVPVDQAARAIVHLSATTPCGFGSFHESARLPRHWRESVLWMNLFGYPVALVPYERWITQLAQDAASADHALYRLRGFFLRRRPPDGATVPELYQEGRGSAPRSRRTQILVSEVGLDFQRLDAALLERYFDEYVAAGFLPPPRRTQWSAASASGTEEAPDRTRLERLLRQRFADDSVAVIGVTLRARGSEHSIVGELTSWRHRGRTGLFHHRLDLAGRDGQRTLDVVTKVKPPDRELIEVAEAVAGICDPRLARAVRRHRDRIGLRGAHLRELALYAEPDERLRRHTPVCYGTWQDETREEWGLVLERLEGRVLMDATEDPAVWTRDRVGAALDGLAEIQAVWFGREAHLASRPWIGHVPTSESMVAMTPLWRALGSHAARYLTEWADASIVRRQRALVESVGAWWPSLEAAPRTLVHNDFSPRNVAIRDAGGSPRLCAYDWELATLGAPQCDLAHFLCFVLDPGASRDEIRLYVERHRAALARATGAPIDPRAWEAGFGAALADLLINRLMFYVLINRVRPLQFLPRIVRTWQRIHDLFDTPVRNDS